MIEFARSQLGHADAHSAEFSKETKHPMVVFMPEVSRTHMGGTMRLGARRTVLSRPTCVTAQLYGGVTARSTSATATATRSTSTTSKKLEAKGLEFVGRDTTGERMEVFELANHPYFVGCQFHPEFKSRPMKRPRSSSASSSPPRASHPGRRREVIRARAHTAPPRPEKSPPDP